MTPIWKFLTSLRLTVVCLFLALTVVFFGTWAQVDDGLWMAQQHWFRSYILWATIPKLGWKIPWVGGYFVGAALLVNLIAAHIHRFQWGWKKFGIQLSHAGVIVILLGGLMTDRMARESLISFREGQTKIYSESHRDDELVFVTDFDTGRDQVVSIPGDRVAQMKDITNDRLPFTVRIKEFQPNGEVISRDKLNQTAGRLMTAIATVEGEYSTAEGLATQAERSKENEGRVNVWRAALKAVGQPEKGDIVDLAKKAAAQPEVATKLLTELKTRFKTEMLARFGQGDAAMRVASERIKKGETPTAEAFPPVSTNGSGKQAIAVPMPVSNDMDHRNIPYAVLELVEGGTSKGTWLVSPFLEPEEITAGGKTFRMAYRFERYYQPFSLTLVKATHEIYPGTATAMNPEGIPKNFQSRVRITNNETGEKREVDIYMNNPLRYGGLTFYQYQMGADEAAGKPIATSTLQVVKNPSWLTPYLGCLMVAGGLIYQFGYHLLGFIGKRLAPDKTGAGASSKKKRADRTPQTVA